MATIEDYLDGNLNPGELKTPMEWEQIFRITVYDPDGWRPGCFLGEKSFTEPITAEEFNQRAMQSTILFNTRFDDDGHSV